MLLEFCLKKELRVCQIHWLREVEKRKVTFRMGKIETEIDFVLTKKQQSRFIRNVNVNPGELQQSLVVAEIDKKKIKNADRKTCAERRKTILLKDVKIRK